VPFGILGNKCMADSLELFNSHQEDVRRRVDSLGKAILILAGGTLTVSIEIFTGVFSARTYN
jgi:hypothetical protein